MGQPKDFRNRFNEFWLYVLVGNNNQKSNNNNNNNNNSVIT